MPYSEGATLEYLQQAAAPAATPSSSMIEEKEKEEKWGYCSAGAARELAEVGY